MPTRHSKTNSKPRQPDSEPIITTEQYNRHLHRIKTTHYLMVDRYFFWIMPKIESLFLADLLSTMSQEFHEGEWFLPSRKSLSGWRNEDTEQYFQSFENLGFISIDNREYRDKSSYLQWAETWVKINIDKIELAIDKAIQESVL